MLCAMVHSVNGFETEQPLGPIHNVAPTSRSRWPRRARPCERGTAECDEEPGLGPARGLPASLCRADHPGCSTDDDHQHGRDEVVRQQSTHDGAELAGVADGPEVGAAEREQCGQSLPPRSTALADYWPNCTRNTCGLLLPSTCVAVYSVSVGEVSA